MRPRTQKTATSKRLCRVLGHVDVDSHFKNCSIKRVDKDQITSIVKGLTLEMPAL